VRLRYNGPGHKTLGVCNRGQIIEVASAEYAQTLVDDGLVTRQLVQRRRKSKNG